MIDLLFDNSEIRRDISKKTAQMRDILLTFADKESPLVNQIAKETIFAGKGKNSLQVRTGSTQAEGLLQRRYTKFKGSRNIAGESYWSRITNIMDNYKERKRKGLLRALKKNFEADSRVQSIFNSALDRMKD